MLGLALNFASIHQVGNSAGISKVGGNKQLLIAIVVVPSILPPMSLEEALETTKIHSVVGKTKDHGLLYERPFRAPHHTISDVKVYNVEVLM